VWTFFELLLLPSSIIHCRILLANHTLDCIIAAQQLVDSILNSRLRTFSWLYSALCERYRIVLTFFFWKKTIIHTIVFSPLIFFLSRISVVITFERSVFTSRGKNAEHYTNWTMSCSKVRNDVAHKAFFEVRQRLRRIGEGENQNFHIWRLSHYVCRQQLHKLWLSFFLSVFPSSVFFRSQSVVITYAFISNR
jgi:hypothetical protein